MGAVTGLIGMGGGAAGSGFSGPQGTNIVNPTNQTQLGNSYAATQAALGGQNALLGALTGQNGLANQNQVYNQLQQVASGQGPNPAQAMLNQSTGQNVANQAALMAGQRGAAGNVGLMARQSAQQGANLQQQAVGQGASMQANQSLGALGAAGQMANTQAGNQINQTNAAAAAQQAEHQALMNAQLGVNNSNVSMQSNTNNVNGQLAATTMQGQQQIVGGLMNGGGALASMFAAGGEVDPGTAPAQPTPNFIPPPAQSQSSGKGGGALGMLALLANGGDSTGPRSHIGKHCASKDYSVGGPVQAAAPIQKASKSGNSYSNDKIPALLSEHEIVIPRNITMGANPIQDSAKFVAAVLAKRGAK